MASCTLTVLPAELRYHLNPQANKSDEGLPVNSTARDRECQYFLSKSQTAF